MAKKFAFRDVSVGLQKLREFLLGRKHVLHGRFTPMLAPRSLPVPDVPRGPDFKYYDKYYYKRNLYNSIQPPVVAPVAEGPPLITDPTKKSPIGGIRADAISFNCAPTPGPAWWWDGHCYFECIPDAPTTPTQQPHNEPDPYCPQESSPATK
ncbi:uncharacterized protein LOC128198917 [Bicyclus anynana]|uniref:NADH dehydrogenase [ubiquinone] 1 alpha subcomplex subunit 7 n=1 Tax=Bicyclus anynana TaxID=110368 RepID=A0ABM3LU65_BICAN|nr:uncharacterized protein LOC128198917 [Bicyclus anynana]